MFREESPTQKMDETVALEIDAFEKNLDRQGISSKYSVSYAAYLFLAQSLSQSLSSKPKYSGTPTEVMMQMQKDLDANAKKDAAQSRAFLQNLKVCDIISFVYHQFSYTGQKC